MKKKTIYVKSPIIIDKTGKYKDFTDSYIYLIFAINTKFKNGIIDTINGIKVVDNTLYNVRSIKRYINKEGGIILLEDMYSPSFSFDFFKKMDTSYLYDYGFENNLLHIVIRYKIDNEGNVILEKKRTITHISFGLSYEENTFLPEISLGNFKLLTYNKKTKCIGHVSNSGSNVPIVDITDKHTVKVNNKTETMGSVNFTSMLVPDGESIDIILTPIESYRFSKYTTLKGDFDVEELFDGEKKILRLSNIKSDVEIDVEFELAPDYYIKVKIDTFPYVYNNSIYPKFIDRNMKDGVYIFKRTELNSENIRFSTKYKDEYELKNISIIDTEGNRSLTVKDFYTLKDLQITKDSTIRLNYEEVVVKKTYIYIDSINEEFNNDDKFAFSPAVYGLDNNIVTKEYILDYYYNGLWIEIPKEEDLTRVYVDLKSESHVLTNNRFVNPRKIITSSPYTCYKYNITELIKNKINSIRVRIKTFYNGNLVDTRHIQKVNLLTVNGDLPKSKLPYCDYYLIRDDYNIKVEKIHGSVYVENIPPSNVVYNLNIRDLKLGDNTVCIFEMEHKSERKTTDLRILIRRHQKTNGYTENQNSFDFVDNELRSILLFRPIVINGSYYITSREHNSIRENELTRMFISKNISPEYMSYVSADFKIGRRVRAYPDITLYLSDIHRKYDVFRASEVIVNNIKYGLYYTGTRYENVIETPVCRMVFSKVTRTLDVFDISGDIVMEIIYDFNLS